MVDQMVFQKVERMDDQSVAQMELQTELMTVEAKAGWRETTKAAMTDSLRDS